MEALTVLSKLIGCYERWQEIRKPYTLHWTNGNESLQALQTFFDNNLTLDSMLSMVKEMMCVLPRTMPAVIRFACLTGLRPSEACESVRLIIFTRQKYYNPEQQRIRTFSFSWHISAANKKGLSVISEHRQLSRDCNFGSQNPAGRYKFCMWAEEDTDEHMHLCRIIFASYILHKGIGPEIVDLLLGRVSQLVLTRHFLAPSHDLKNRVLDAVVELQKRIQRD